MSVKKALHENAAFCISCLWEQLKINLIVFGGLPWGLCRQEYGKAPTRDLASIINFFDKPESSEAWQLAPRDMEEGTTRSFRFSSCLPDIYSNDLFFPTFCATSHKEHNL